MLPDEPQIKSPPTSDRGGEHERADFVRGWSEGWQCACLKADGSLPPESQVREALTFAGFSDELIESAFGPDCGAG